MREGKNDMSKFYNTAFLLLAFVVFNLQVFTQSVTADFSWNQTCKEFKFFDNSIPVGGTIVQWDWDFGDGFGSSTDPDPLYTYLTPGDYTVTLTVTLEDLITTDQTSEIIYIDPIAEFGYIQICDYFEFLDQSTASTGNITDWLWDFGDSNTSTDQNPIYTYPAEGEYTVLLTVTHESGCEDTVSQVVSFYYPTAAFSYINICEHFIFQNQSTVTSGTLSYLWDFGDTFTST
ncbi:MAG: PKD domain-containing protein, partial [Bacteroidales bacterium]|nr:PKD domain-containing protein [Bacteroidales bacterium]